MCQVFISATPKEENYLNHLKIQRHFNYNKVGMCGIWGFQVRKLYPSQKKKSKEAVSVYIGYTRYSVHTNNY